MLNIITIGSSATLDMQTRTLTRVEDGASITLPVSACHCLKALVEAKEDVLSQEQLMDVGWRNAGVEVTENSVRVMINKIRRAILTLEMQNSMTLLAVTRSGYRLIIRDISEEPEPEAVIAPQKPEAPTPEKTITSSAPSPAAGVKKTSRWPRRALIALAGAAAGSLAAVLAISLVKVEPDDVHFVHWSGDNIPPQTEVWVPAERQHQTAAIRKTLQLYRDYALKREAKSEQARHLYITIGDNPQFVGLIACVDPLQASENNCESYYFKDR
ncbi:winged helix-turn-helix domain-containing protein [Cedecea sp.]|jgi:DNA-binding winged helix-turn-helix (wHTH) protein|uniref:winged helix-turn-helix domain-containing protein n=1 Tax=Cedecea sp. TaxID=1970739 RepID=UPI0012AD5FFF|nr:winged helix family transcriptional regulator [Enterobacteriaceae bacterium RIT693]